MGLIQKRSSQKKQTRTKPNVKINKNARNKYTITILDDRCKGCGLCVIFCPLKILEMSTKINPNGYFLPRIKNLDNCQGCNLCSKYCPDFAIFSLKCNVNKT